MHKEKGNSKVPSLPLSMLTHSNQSYSAGGLWIVAAPQNIVSIIQGPAEIHHGSELLVTRSTATLLENVMVIL
jgi:hypothetical protein